jgi:hypothetical protein
METNTLAKGGTRNPKREEKPFIHAPVYYLTSGGDYRAATYFSKVFETPKLSFEKGFPFHMLHNREILHFDQQIDMLKALV